MENVRSPSHPDLVCQHFVWIPMLMEETKVLWVTVAHIVTQIHLMTGTSGSLSVIQWFTKSISYDYSQKIIYRLASKRQETLSFMFKNQFQFHLEKHLLAFRKDLQARLAVSYLCYQQKPAKETSDFPPCDLLLQVHSYSGHHSRGE